MFPRPDLICIVIFGSIDTPIGNNVAFPRPVLFLSPPSEIQSDRNVSSQQNQHSDFAARTRHTGRRVRRDKRVKGFGIPVPLSPRVLARLKCSSGHLPWRAVPRTSERSNLLSWHVPKSRRSRRFRRRPAARSKNGPPSSRECSCVNSLDCISLEWPSWE